MYGEYNNDTTGSRYVAWRFQYVRQDTALKELKFEWIGIKFQLVYIPTKVGYRSTFGHL